MKRTKVNLINKKGDTGTTSLYPLTRISKSSLRIDALGDLDELGAVLGLARFHTKNKKTKAALREIQKNLFRLGSELATPSSFSKRLTKSVNQKFLNDLEKRVKNLQDKTTIYNEFTLPGKVLCAAHINHGRTIARRLERKIVWLYELKQIKNKLILAWINRLSVYLYILSRAEEPNPDFLN